MSLNNQSNALANLGRLEEALDAITEAVTIRRALATARPEAFGPDLASSLYNQSNTLADLGRYKEALAAATEALDVFPRLNAQRAVFMPVVVRLLVLQGVLRTQLDDLEGADSADRTAVSVCAGLVSADPDRYQDMYDNAIRSFEAHLEGLGRTPQEIAEEVDRLLKAGDQQGREQPL